MNKTLLFILLILLLILLVLFLVSFYKKVETFEQKYTAIIVEPRKHPALRYVLNNFCTNLSDDWQFIIFHGNLNKEFVEEIIDDDLQKYKDKIKLIDLHVDNLQISDYNKLFKSLEFYDNIPTETFLVFQTDSIICSENKEKLKEFLHYDFVGAPWKEGDGGTEVRNGGLSLRKKSKMIEILQNKPGDDMNEDVYFCHYDNINKPEFDESKKFSVESIFYDSPFGVHKAWAYLSDDEQNELNEHCKAYKTLKEKNMK